MNNGNAKASSDPPQRSESDGQRPEQSAVEAVFEPDDVAVIKVRWNAVGAFIQGVANVATALAAALLLLQLWTNDVERKRERSLEFVRDWSEDGYSDRLAAIRLITERRRRQSGLEDMDLLPEGKARAHANLAANWTRAAISTEASGAGSADEQFLKNVDQVTFFFEQLEICLAAELCDSVVLRDFFAPTVASFWEYFVGHAHVRRGQGYPDFGIRVPRLIERFARIQKVQP